MKDTLQLYIDGSYRQKTDKGAYAVLAVLPDNKNIIASEVYITTTNNKMELKALIAALEAIIKYQLDTHYNVEIFSDSQYTLKGLQEWYPKWEMNGFKSATGAPVKNKELWVELSNLFEQVTVRLQWVKGHAENQLHNEVDKYVNSLTL